MSLSLPAVRAAAETYRRAVQTSPPDRHSPDARAHAAEKVLPAMDDLRRALTPSDPAWSWSNNPDLDDPAVSGEVRRLLRRLWERLVHHLHSLRPPFSPDQVDEWDALLDETIRALGGCAGETLSGGPRPARIEELPSQLSAADLAKVVGRPVKQVRDWLARYRKKYPACYSEVDHVLRNESPFLYHTADVLPALIHHFGRP
jgi:hypothetical protein